MSAERRAAAAAAAGSRVVVGAPLGGRRHVSRINDDLWNGALAAQLVACWVAWVRSHNCITEAAHPEDALGGLVDPERVLLRGCIDDLETVLRVHQQAAGSDLCERTSRGGAGQSLKESGKPWKGPERRMVHPLRGWCVQSLSLSCDT